VKPRILLFLILAMLLVSCAQSNPTPLANLMFIDTGVNSADWALVPEGPFYLGQHGHQGEIDYAYEIMVTDVTNAQYAEYLNRAISEGFVKQRGDELVGYYPGDVFHGYEHEERIESGDWLHLPLNEEGLRIQYEDGDFLTLSGYENHPMVQVTWFGAKAYCEFYGWRLPSELEWEKAARGEDERPYPWGWEIENNQANFYSSHDIFEKTFGKLGDTTPVGFYNGHSYDGYETLNGASPYGLYDMAGNVWQWAADDYEDQHYRYMRGGSKQDYAYNLRVWTRNSAAPYYYSPNVGFRCARDAK
jgi:formylglycine-generating enzyme required for sulfatase activity